MTNRHVIDEEYIKKNKEIQLTLNNDKEEKKIKINEINGNRAIYISNEELDTTIIEIKPDDKISEDSYLDIDENISTDLNNYYNKESVYIIHYPKSEEVKVSYGIINDIADNNINHFCCTENGSSGSPIINLDNNKIIGIHKKGAIGKKFNIGSYLKQPINDFINEYKTNTIMFNIEKEKKNEEFKIEDNIINDNNDKNEIVIKVKIEENDVGKKKYFLDNVNYTEQINFQKIIHDHDNLGELNESNVDLYIDNKQYKYEKFFEPKKEGEYEIKLIFKKPIINCNSMFEGCTIIKNFNFEYFNTKEVITMKKMFKGCKNLENLDLSSFNTKNVIDMSGMFNGCEKIMNINLSSFDTQNVTNMSEMFFHCKKLTNLNLSSLNTKNVTNMFSMFNDCKELKQLDLSSFEIKDGTNKMNIFYGCDSLELKGSFFKK